MRTNKTITISQIKLRESAMLKKSLNENASDNSYLYNLVEKSIESKSSTLKDDAFKLFKGCTDFKNANSNVGLCLNVLEQVSDNAQLYNVLEGVFCREIIPYIENLEGLKNSVAKSNLSEASINKINDAIKTNKICDRIRNNNTQMSARFNFDKIIKESAYKSYENNVIKICSMIDTYSTPSYAKLNIALEEISYLFQKNSIKYDPARMVQLVAEYFINANNNMTKDQFNDFKDILKENCCITDDDLSLINYFVEDFEVSQDNDIPNGPINAYTIPSISVNTTNNCLDSFNQFKASPNKTPEAFIDAINTGSREERIDTLNTIFDWLRNFAILELDDSNSYCNIMFEFVKSIVNTCETILSSKILDIVIKECDKVTILDTDDKIYNNDNFSYYSNTVSKILNYVRERYDTVTEMASNISSNNVLRDVNEEVMSLSEFKLLKFNNLISYAADLDRALARKEGKLKEKIVNKAKEIFNSAKEWLKEDYDISNSKNENIIDCITEKYTFDHIVAIYEATEDVEKVKEAFENFCINMSNKISDPHVYVYCETVDNIIEIHITDTTFISLTESENDEWLSTFTESEQAYAGYLLSMMESFDEFERVASHSMADDFAKIESTLTSDGILGIIEASKYLNGMLTLDRLQEIAENYAYNNPMDYMGNTAISQALDNWKLEEATLDIVVETVSMIREAIDESLLSEANKPNAKVNTKSANGNNNEKEKKGPSLPSFGKKKEDKDNKKDQKSEKTKINFNTLKYAMVTLNQKAKKAGDKATSATQTLNIYVEKFITAVQKLYTNDNREQIIKGSIIPSFHQLMGRLLVVAGITTGTGFIYGASAAVFAAVVSIFATIAISKHSTDKERALMLDEIQIELEICEKEMQNAESRGQLKKYRALMYRQTKLKREYQRIRYNIGYSDYKHAPIIDKKD